MYVEVTVPLHQIHPNGTRLSIVAENGQELEYRGECFLLPDGWLKMPTRDLFERYFETALDHLRENVNEALAAPTPGGPK